MNGDDRYHAGPFSIGEWIVFQEYLASADVVMQVLAPDAKASIKRDVDGDWPARSLIRRRGLHVHELSLLLNPEYLSTWELSFELHERYCLALLRYSRVVSQRTLGRYTSIQIRDVSFMSSVLEAWIVRTRISLRGTI